VRDGLTRGAAAEDPGRERDGEVAEHEGRRAEQLPLRLRDELACGAHGAEARAAEQAPRDEPDAERERPRRVRGTARAEPGSHEDPRACQEEEAAEDRGGVQTHGHGRRCGAADAVALLLEGAHEHARHEAREPEPCVHVAAAQPLEHAEQAAQEHERPDGHERPRDEPRRGVAARARDVAPPGEAQHERAEDEPDQLGSHVRGRRGAARRALAEEAERPGLVAQEARAADPHVPGVALPDEERGERADDGEAHEAEGEDTRGGGIAQHAASPDRAEGGGRTTTEARGEGAIPRSRGREEGGGGGSPPPPPGFLGTTGPAQPTAGGRGGRTSRPWDGRARCSTPSRRRRRAPQARAEGVAPLGELALLRGRRRGGAFPGWRST
jgi:hypothetical protein